MNQTEQYFLRILSDHLNRERTVPENVDWGELYELSIQHQVTAIVFYQCKDFIPDNEKYCFQSIYSQQLFSYTNRLKLLKDIKLAFDEIKLQYSIVKGYAVAQYYPIPQLRSSGDIDILITNREKAGIILENMGFSIEKKPEDHDWAYFKNEYEIELHDRLIYPQAINTDKLVNFFNDFQKYISADNDLDDSFHFMYVLLHLRKHIMNDGVGFRQFLDIAMMIKNCNTLDWEWIKETLKEIKLYDFTSVCFSLIHGWFETEVPFQSQLSEDFFEEATNKIFADGIFGRGNEENRNNYVINQNKDTSHPKINMVSTMLKSLFPKYEVVIMSSHYNFLIGKPYLLPIAWVYRIYRGVKYGRTNEGIEILKSHFISNEKIEERKAFYAKWGLTD